MYNLPIWEQVTELGECLVFSCISIPSHANGFFLSLCAALDIGWSALVEILTNSCQPGPWIGWLKLVTLQWG